MHTQNVFIICIRNGEHESIGIYIYNLVPLHGMYSASCSEKSGNSNIGTKKGLELSDMLRDIFSLGMQCPNQVNSLQN